VRRGAAVLVFLLVAAVFPVGEAGASSELQWTVQTLKVDGAALQGTPVDVIGVGAGYLGLVTRDAHLWVVTSKDGGSWKVTEPVGLTGVDTSSSGAYPGGLNNVQHVLFTDGKRVFFRAQSGASFNALGSTTLFESDKDGASWEPVALPTPEGRGAFPITALEVDGTAYVAGAVYEPTYGQSYLDGAVWSSTDGTSWTLNEAAAFGGDGNQTVFALTAADGGLVAGGGDSSLIPVDACCFFPDGLAFWRGSTNGTWERGPVSQPPYGPHDQSAVVGVLGHGRALEAVISGNRTATSRDGGRTWAVQVTPPPTGPKSVFAPRADFILHFGRRLIGTTTPAEFCADCNQGALAISSSGQRWMDVTPRFPCGQRQTRPSYGFVSKPVAVGGAVTALGGCGPNLQAFDETLLAVSDDGGRHWRIERYDGKTGTPLSAVAGHHRIVTLTYDQGNAAGTVRATTMRS
jgi:hypothetical protein